ncbi:MAG: hypothetical protein JWM54_436 [Acidobacteriaceae bacterium]|nr:hypothetical protein [Acidobacteriaceae bacterium]
MTIKGYEERRVSSRFLRKLAPALFLLISVTAPFSQGQSKTASSEYVPLPDPGYGFYYHDSDAEPNIATRWGYHDGWEDGRRDRNHGETAEAKDKPRFSRPANHDLEGRLSRDQYQSLYRQAYQRGYEHGAMH